MNKIAGPKVKPDRLVDRKRPCCKNICIITAGGELVCADCGQHGGWLSEKTTRWIEHIATRFGAPETITVHRDAEPPAPMSETERQQRIKLINRRIAAEGFAPRISSSPKPHRRKRWTRSLDGKPDSAGAGRLLGAWRGGGSPLTILQPFPDIPGNRLRRRRIKCRLSLQRQRQHQCQVSMISTRVSFSVPPISRARRSPSLSTAWSRKSSSRMA